MELANELCARLQIDPSAFSRLQEQYCCANDVWRWRLGNGDAALDAAVEQLPLGAIAARPVDLGYYFVIPRRIDVTQTPPAPLLYALPSRSAPDLDAIILHSRPTALIAELRLLKSALHGQRLFAERFQQSVVHALSELEVAFTQAQTPEQRLDAKQRVLLDLRNAIGDAEFARFEHFLDAWAAQRVLRQQILMPKSTNL